MSKSSFKSDLHFFSSAFENGGYIPLEYTCYAKDEQKFIRLYWEIKGSALRRNVKSFAVGMIDVTTEFVHFLVYDIPSTESELTEDNFNIIGKTGYNSYFNTNYIPPCPKDNKEHEYLFFICALDIEELPKGKIFYKDIIEFCKTNGIYTANIYGKFKNLSDIKNTSENKKWTRRMF